MKKIGIYPGTFQPADKSHYEVYKKLKSIVGADAFVATTDREPVPEAPLNFGDKQQILVRHGVPASHIIKVKSLPVNNKEEWRPQEIYQTFPENQTAVIIVLNPREAALFSARKKQNTTAYDAMSSGIRQELQEIYNELQQERTGESPTQEIWLDSKGSPSYFQPYDAKNQELSPLSEHAYIVVMDDTKIQGHAISTSNIRSVLGSTKYDDKQKKQFFRFVFGWFDVGLYQLMVSKFRNAHQVAYTGPGLQETVYSVLKDVMEEDYSSAINTPDSSTNMTNISGDDTSVNGDSQAKINSQNRQTLIKQKKELEDKSKQNKQQRDGYQTVVKNYDTFQKKNDRDAIDGINKQLSQPSTQPIQPM